MKIVKYFIQFLLIMFLFGAFKILGFKFSKILSGSLMIIFGRFFRSKDLIFSNLSRAFPNLNEIEKKKILEKMWFNYGKIFAEYMFIKNFRKKPSSYINISIENKNILEKIKINSEPVIFISGHFNNFELMAMEIERSGVDLAAIYRPLNNPFLNPFMERIRKKYICKKQIKKGISGTKQLLENFKNGTSIALMIDQRVSQGIRCNFFGDQALTTTIPAQFVKKFNAKIVPVYISRSNDKSFKITYYKPIEFQKNTSTESITLKLNNLLENMIIKNPDQWIWTHNRWK